MYRWYDLFLNDRNNENFQSKINKDSGYLIFLDITVNINMSYKNVKLINDKIQIRINKSLKKWIAKYIMFNVQCIKWNYKLLYFNMIKQFTKCICGILSVTNQIWHIFMEDVYHSYFTPPLTLIFFSSILYPTHGPVYIEYPLAHTFRKVVLIRHKPTTSFLCCIVFQTFFFTDALKCFRTNQI